jgi:branched-chain amino acid transport system ATP-binding protein
MIPPQAAAMKASSMTMPVQAMRVSGLDKWFGGLHATVNVSFTVPDGSLTAIIGPNGAGKTTLFNLITNLFAPSAGEIHFYGNPIQGLTTTQIAKRGLIRTFQTARVFPGMTALENVMAGAYRLLRQGMARQMLWLPQARKEERQVRERALALMEIAGLQRFADMTATDLPMGAQKLLEILRALMAGPRLLLLDEPAAGLNDSETAELSSLLRTIRDCGVTIVLVEHNMSLVMGIASQVIVLDAGNIVATGSPEEIQNDPRVIEAYVGQMQP